MVVTMIGRVVRVLPVSGPLGLTLTRKRVVVPGEMDRNENLLEDKADRHDRCRDRVSLPCSVRMHHAPKALTGRPKPRVGGDSREEGEAGSL